MSVASKDSPPMVKLRCLLRKSIGILECQSKEEYNYKRITIEAGKTNSERVQNI